MWGSIVTFRHQHAVSKLPLRAGAQSFGPPHSGQVRLGLGIMDFSALSLGAR